MLFLSTSDNPEIPAWYDQWWALTLAIGLAIFVLTLLCGILIARKAGYSGWWGAVAVLVPVIGPILVVVFALAKWPALRERDEAIGVLEERGIAIPSRVRAAEKEEQEKAKVEAEAKKRVDAARAEREKAEHERREVEGETAPGAASGEAKD